MHKTRWMCLVIAAMAASFRLLGQGVVDRLDHERTGFSLEGRHASLPCESCHLTPDFGAAPRRCSQCHNGVLADGMTFRHIPAAAPCDQCHTPLDWRTARFDHTEVAVGCVRCHNNFLAPGKTVNHPATNDSCESCHNTIHWDQILPTAAPSAPNADAR